MAQDTLVSVHPLRAGIFTLPESAFVQPSDPNAKRTVPSLSFLIQHHSANRTTRLIFDLGIRRDISTYPQLLQDHLENRRPFSTSPDVIQSLESGGLKTSDIDMVLLSHVHWDHVGTPSAFPDSLFMVGNGALDVLSGKTKYQSASHQHFEPDLLPAVRTVELSSPNGPSEVHNGHLLDGKGIPAPKWQSLGPLPHTIDLFGDGSLFIVSAPGHLAGHINLLCRIGTDRYVYLAGDAFHDRRLLTGEREIAVRRDPEDPGVMHCIHVDPEEARKTIARVREVQDGRLGGLGDVEVVSAHEADWITDPEREARFWPGRL